MYVKPTFGAVYRLMQNGQPVTDGNVVSQIQATDTSKLPQGDMHMNHPVGKTKGYYIISPPDTDTFTALTGNLKTTADWAALEKALLEKRQDFNLCAKNPLPGPCFHPDVSAPNRWGMIP